MTTKGLLLALSLVVTACVAPKSETLLRQWPEKITGNQCRKTVIEKNKLQPLSTASPAIRLRVISSSSWGYSVFSLLDQDDQGEPTLQVIDSDIWDRKGKIRDVSLTSAQAAEIERLANTVFTSNLPKERFPPPETVVIDGGDILIERADGAWLLRDRLAQHEKEIVQLMVKLFELDDSIAPKK